MRKVSLMSLSILAAFAFGVFIGGQTPREASALDALDELTWEQDGESLILVNQTTDQGFFVEGALKPGSAALVPAARIQGKLVLESGSVGEVLISRKVPLYHCTGVECRSCTDTPILCVYPPKPFPGPPVDTSVDPFSKPR